jgi:hypothetical protein
MILRALNKLTDPNIGTLWCRTFAMAMEHAYAPWRSWAEAQNSNVDVSEDA